MTPASWLSALFIRQVLIDERSAAVLEFSFSANSGRQTRSYKDDTQLGVNEFIGVTYEEIQSRPNFPQGALISFATWCRMSFLHLTWSRHLLETCNCEAICLILYSLIHFLSFFRAKLVTHSSLFFFSLYELWIIAKYLDFCSSRWSKKGDILGRFSHFSDGLHGIMGRNTVIPSLNGMTKFSVTYSLGSWVMTKPSIWTPQLDEVLSLGGSLFSFTCNFCIIKMGSRIF